MTTKKTVKTAPKTKTLYLAYDAYDDSWELVHSKNFLGGFAFYAEVKVPAGNPRNSQKPAKIGTFEIEVVEAEAA